ncbi:MAG TPA: hypothetical protein VL486_03680 [Verrucomicrobiae bacterium]|nr:hypothetical protein [Verrucomicrobiae bacterium]
MNASITKRVIVIGVAALLWAAVPMISWGAQPAPGPKPGAQAPAKTEPQQETSGKIGAIDQQKHTLTVSGMILNKTFDVPANAVIVTKDKPKARFTDLKVGDEVNVTYHTVGEKLVAQRIEVAEPKVGEMPSSPSRYPSI